MEHRQLYIDLGRKNSATEKRNVKWTPILHSHLSTKYTQTHTIIKKT